MYEMPETNSLHLGQEPATNSILMNSSFYTQNKIFEKLSLLPCHLFQVLAEVHVPLIVSESFGSSIH